MWDALSARTQLLAAGARAAAEGATAGTPGEVA